MQVHSDDNIKGKVMTTTGGTASWNKNPAAGKPLTKQPRVIANGDDLILLDISAGSENMYFIFRDFNVNDLNIQVCQDNFPTMSLTGRSYGGGVEGRQINIPTHIPVDQHVRYIQGVFGKSGGIN